MQKTNRNVIIESEDIQVSIAPDVIKAFKTVQEQGDFRKERGGILAGYYNSSGNCLVISDITFPQDKDICSHFRFLRKSQGHQDIMDDLWEQSEHRKSYLGEWHTHNQQYPVPSHVDTCNWKKISKREHNFDELFFVIVGTDNIGVWCIKQGTVLEVDRI